MIPMRINIVSMSDITNQCGKSQRNADAAGLKPRRPARAIPFRWDSMPRHQD
jgi:hypothetical protein